MIIIKFNENTWLKENARDIKTSLNHVPRKS